MHVREREAEAANALRKGACTDPWTAPSFLAQGPPCTTGQPKAREALLQPETKKPKFEWELRQEPAEGRMTGAAFLPDKAGGNRHRQLVQHCRIITSAVCYAMFSRRGASWSGPC